MKSLLILIFLSFTLGIVGCGGSDKHEDDELEQAKSELNLR